MNKNNMFKIRLIVPPGFDFGKTVAMLQRGNMDPINIINKNNWTRCFYYNNEVHLIDTKYKMTSKTINVSVLLGNLKEEFANDIVKSSLGFDDPLLHGLLIDIPNLRILDSVLGLTIPGYPDLFEATVQIIMGQQISVIVANTIRAAFTKAIGGIIMHNNINYYYFPLPETVLIQSVEELQKLGLSLNKAKAILSVAQSFLKNQDILNFSKKSTSEHIRDVLIKIYGIGNWTIEWLLLRNFRRFDVIPSTDLAIQKAFSWWLNKNSLMSAKELKSYEEIFYPYGGAIAYRILAAYSLSLKRNGDI